MIATLILFTCGRSIAYWINGGATPTVTSPIIESLGGFIPGVPVPTPVFIVILCGIVFALLFRFTNLGFYTQAVGINQQAARLNGINSTWIKMLTFIILGVCVAFAGCIRVGRLGLVNHEYGELKELALGQEEKAVAAKVETLKAEATHINQQAYPYLETNARFALAYDAFLAKYGYDSVAISCWPKFQDDFLYSICSVVGEINDKGVVAACEGDLTSAVSMQITG